MVISAYQVNNVLRVYGDQLRQSRISGGAKSVHGQSQDKINISVEAKRKAIVERIASDIIERITQDGPNDYVGKEVFQKLEREYGAHLAMTQQNGASGFVFKEIDETGETINSLSIEDSEFLSYKLKEITKATINENMF